MKVIGLLILATFIGCKCSCPVKVKYVRTGFGGSDPYCDVKNPGKNMTGHYDYEVCGPSND